MLVDHIQNQQAGTDGGDVLNTGLRPAAAVL
jgi:hypothetical protein